MADRRFRNKFFDKTVVIKNIMMLKIERENYVNLKTDAENLVIVKLMWRIQSI